MLVSSRNGPHTESAMGLDARESARVNVCHCNIATRCPRSPRSVIKDCCGGTRFVVGSISDREHGSCTGSSHSANADYWRTCRGTPTSRAANRLIHLFVKGLTKPMTACPCWSRQPNNFWYCRPARQEVSQICDKTSQKRCGMGPNRAEMDVVPD